MRQAISQPPCAFGRQLHHATSSRSSCRRFKDASGRVVATRSRAQRLPSPQQSRGARAQLGSALVSGRRCRRSSRPSRSSCRRCSQLRGPESAELAGSASRKSARCVADRAKCCAEPSRARRPQRRRLRKLSPQLSQPLPSTIASRRRCTTSTSDRRSRSRSSNSPRKARPTSRRSTRPTSMRIASTTSGRSRCLRRCHLLALFTEWYAPATGLFRHREDGVRPLVG